MSNRMSVLSRRLERFAGIFSIATFASFLGAFFASAKAEGQLVYLCAGLAAVCLFAAFFLWVAHGFAWALIPEEPLVAKRPAEALLKPAAAMRPAEEMKPAEIKPAEEKKPAEAIKPAPAAAMKAAETKRPAEEKKPAETMNAVEERKPAEEKAITEEDPADAKYTITGKRIY